MLGVEGGMRTHLAILFLLLLASLFVSACNGCQPDSPDPDAGPAQTDEHDAGTVEQPDAGEQPLDAGSEDDPPGMDAGEGEDSGIQSVDAGDDSFE